MIQLTDREVLVLVAGIAALCVTVVVLAYLLLSR
jgi:hypothetical protein